MEGTRRHGVTWAQRDMRTEGTRSDVTWMEGTRHEDGGDG